MKKFCLLLVGVIAISCQKTLSEEALLTYEDDLQSYRITPEDISEYYNSVFNKNSTKSSILEIKPFIHKNDTIMYEVFSNNSYKIFSADKRFPPVLAYYDGESNVSITDNPYLRNWIECEADRFIYIKNQLPSTYDNQHTRLWDRVLLKRLTKLPETKADGDPEEDDGFWRWISTDTTDTDVVCVDHLCKAWHQGDPYNMGMPYQYLSNQRCAVGCVAVATANILLYTHNRYGCPSTSPTSCECNGWYETSHNHNYTVSFGQRTAQQWQLINSDNTTAVTALLSWIAHNINLYFGAESGATTSDMIDFIEEEGITGLYVSYDGYNAFQSVFRKGEPVYIESEVYENGVKIGRHVYLIDKAIEVTYTTESLYEYVPYHNNGVSTGETMVETEYLTDRYVSLRWGWQDTSYDNINLYITYWDNFPYGIPVETRDMVYNFKLK